MARYLCILLMFPLACQALQSLNDSSLSNVVAQEGIRLLTEYEATIDDIQYFDDKNAAASDLGGGKLTFLEVSMRTRAKQYIDIDVVDGTSSSIAGIDRSGRKGVRLSSQELPIDFSVSDFRINNDSLGEFGLINYTTGGISPIIIDLWAGGYDEAGLTLDIIFPKESSYSLYYEEDGTRLSSSINYCADEACINGGLILQDITVDIVAKGLRLGLPTITNGTFNVTDFRIGVSDTSYSNINEVSLSNINVGPGGYLILGAPENAGETAITFDMVLGNSNFDFIFYDASDSAKDSIEASMQLSGLNANGLATAQGEINVLEKTVSAEGIVSGGLRIDYGAEFQVVATDIIMRPAGETSVPVLGSFELNLQILGGANGSYLEVMGH